MKYLLATITAICFALSTNASSPPKKTIYIPKKSAEGINFNNPDSEYSNSRKKETANFVIFWSKEYGNSPSKNPVENQRFNVDSMASELERYFNYYVDVLKIVKRGKSVVDQHKIICFVTGGPGGTAYGWGQEHVGILWTPAVRINKQPYGVLAHELGHVFQFLCGYENKGTAFDGPINEMGAQYVLWQVLPNWLEFENFHYREFLKNTHRAFLHKENAYHSPFVIEYWAQLHGKDFYGRLMHTVAKGEDAVETYKRLTKTSQEKFNDELFDASRRFITWDLKRVDKVAKPYRNQHFTKLEPMEHGWHQIAPQNCPENYGYNGIKLAVPSYGTTITLSFKGMAKTASNENKHAEKAGWRYGFMAYKKNQKRVYGKMHSLANGTVSFKVPQDTEHLWLVVMGAPKTHTRVSKKEELNNKWPYQIKLTGTILAN